jgi:glutamate synthase domain-containing protein 3
MSMVSLEPVLAESDQFLAESKLAAEGKGRLMHLGRSDEALLRDLMDRHLRYTASSVALRILDDWEAHRGKFVKVLPNEYKRALTEMAAREARTTAAKQLVRV